MVFMFPYLYFKVLKQKAMQRPLGCRQMLAFITLVVVMNDNSEGYTYLFYVLFCVIFHSKGI